MKKKLDPPTYEYINTNQMGTFWRNNSTQIQLGPIDKNVIAKKTWKVYKEYNAALR